MNSNRIIVGISGASGTVIAIRLLEALRMAGMEIHLVVSRAAELTRALETIPCSTSSPATRRFFPNQQNWRG
jgi:3-polyprenyl-4-hydroxybenzoate decarboxylase